MNQKQGKRSNKKKSYYTNQYAVTAANKARRSAKRKRKAALWA